MRQCSEKNIAVMGSTGSIGTQTLDIIREHPDAFHVEVLTANRNWQLLARQALQFRPSMVVIADCDFHRPLKEALKDTGIAVACGADALEEAVSLPNVNFVIGALVGFSGLKSTLKAITLGKQVALANKETLVVAGEIINRQLESSGMRILPIDSEHSAIFQCLVGEDRREMKKIILTASGGPFRRKTLEEMEHVSLQQALDHPNWSMGRKVTIDSATMMNKGFEMIEAKWLFNCSPDEIEIVVHPQSVIHSMVEFIDGSVKAQLGSPDMHLPISYALSYPCRIQNSCASRLDICACGKLTFEKPDFERFPMLRLAYKAVEKGGDMPASLNAANEVAVKAFLDGKIKFTNIFRLVNETVERIPWEKEITLDSLLATHAEATRVAEELLKRYE